MSFRISRLGGTILPTRFGRIAEIGNFFVGQRANLLGRAPQIQIPGFEHAAFRHQRTGAQEHVFLNHRAVEDDAAHADQAFVLDRAGMQDHRMADGDARADHERPARRVGRRLVRDVEHAVVLDVARLANGDRVDVAADHRAGPYRGVGAQADLADHAGARVHPGAGGKLRVNAPIGREGV
jgi:hypothetical protein